MFEGFFGDYFDLCKHSVLIIQSLSFGFKDFTCVIYIDAFIVEDDLSFIQEEWGVYFLLP